MSVDPSKLPPMPSLNVELFTQRLVTDLSLDEHRARRIAEAFAEHPPMILDQKALKVSEEASVPASAAWRAEFDMLGEDLRSEEGEIDFRNHPVGQALIGWITSIAEKLDEDFTLMSEAARMYLVFMVEKDKGT